MLVTPRLLVSRLLNMRTAGSSGVAPGTLLLGDNTAFTGIEALGGANSAWWSQNATDRDNSGQVAVATGSAATAYVRVQAWDGSGENLKVCVWSTSGTLLAVSDVISMAGGTGLRSATFASPPSIVSGTKYRLGLVLDGYVSIHAGSSPYYAWGDDANNYATPINTGAGTERGAGMLGVYIVT